jgi:hypothetical protein
MVYVANRVNWNLQFRKGFIMEKEMTATQVSGALGITMDSIYRLLYAGKLKGRKFDGRWIISAESVEARIKAKEARNKNSERDNQGPFSNCRTKPLNRGIEKSTNL